MVVLAAIDRLERDIDNSHGHSGKTEILIVFETVRGERVDSIDET